MESNVYAIILAGGSGSRLWPLSRELQPKQLMQFSDDDSTFKTTFLRLLSNVDDKNIITATNVNLDSQVRFQLEQLQEKFCRSSCYRMISEPAVKNTAPAVAVGIKYIQMLDIPDDDPVIIVSPSDHTIENEKEYARVLREAVKLAQEDYIVTLGVKPDKPDTGYGYIRTKNNKKIKEISEEALKVEFFTEKPILDVAKEYCESSRYFWNSGIFVFKASVMMEEFKKYAPEIYEIVQNSEISSQSPTIPYVDYNKMPDISLDYAIMEFSKKLVMLPLDCGWHDLGSWEAIYDTAEKDINGNYIQGNVLDLDSKNSMVLSTSKLVATIGLEDMVVVETEDALLVCEKSKTQEVKKVVSLLNEKHDSTSRVHKTVYRPWGWYTVINEGKGFLTKCIQVNPGGKLSLQLHHHRSEHWVIVEGTGIVICEDEQYEMHPGDSININVEEKHSLQNPFDVPVKVIEVQRGDILDENDIVRLSDIYGRV